MSDKGYWNQITRSRLSRRRALIVTGGAAAGAAFLAACGGSDSTGSKEEKAPVDKSGLLYTPVETTSSAKPGGTLKAWMAADILHFDNMLSNQAQVLGSFAQICYLRLVGWQTAKYPKEADGGVIGELAESWEISPDKLTITFKLRQGVKWDPRPPTNGRFVDAQDIMFSWNKFTSVNPGAPSYLYNATSAPSAPIESMSAPDNKTIVLKLKTADAAVLPQLTSAQFSPHPRESDGGFNPKTEVRANGPWFLDEYVQSARISFKKNPDFYIKDRPFYDKLEVPIVSDAAQRLAQFRAGNIHIDVLESSQEQVVITKKDLPQTLMVQASSYPERDIWRATYGWEGNSPFKDQRVRQAMSMMLDREGYIDALDNRAGFRKDGLDLPVKYGTVIGAGWNGYYIDPTDEKAFGPNGKYLKFNLPEAKKLIQAAGFNNGFEFNLYWNNSGNFPIYNRIVEVYNAMFIDGGVKPKLMGMTTQQLQDDYTNIYSDAGFKSGAKKGFNGMLMRTDRPFGAPSLGTYGTMNKNGSYYEGLSPTGDKVQDGDPKVNDLTDKIRAEFDLPKQQALVQELVKYMTGQAYYIPQVSQAKAYSLWWPAIGNLGVYDSSPNESLWKESRLHWWIDQTKAPFKS